MPKKLSRIVPKNHEVSLHSADRAALRSEVYVEAASDKTPGELEAGAMEKARAALQSDPFPEGTENA